MDQIKLHTCNVKAYDLEEDLRALLPKALIDHQRTATFSLTGPEWVSITLGVVSIIEGPLIEMIKKWAGKQQPSATITITLRDGTKIEINRR